MSPPVGSVVRFTCVLRYCCTWFCPRARFDCYHAILFSHHLDCHVSLESSLKIPNVRQSRDDPGPLLIPSFRICVCSLSRPLPGPSEPASFFPSLSVVVSVHPSSRRLFLSLLVSGVCSVFPFLDTCSGLSSVSIPSLFFHLALEHYRCAQ